MEQILDQIILETKNSLQDSFELCKISTFNCFCLSLVILRKLSS